LKNQHSSTSQINQSPVRAYGFGYAISILGVCFILITSLAGFAQVQNSALVARFGIDGDQYSDVRQNGTFSPAGTDDWFKTNNGTGRGIIDTTGAAALKASLAAGNNISFIKGSSIPRFSVTDTILHLDGIYGRDFNDNDKTSFTNGSKNGENPALWGTNPGGGIVQDKSDIIDVFAMMRRNGLSLSNTNPSPLILTMGTTTLGTTGSRYVDFELFVNRISYDPVTGIFSNSGPASQGGHEDFQFNTNGTLKKIGDVIISYTYSSTVVTDISIFIWVNVATYQNTFAQQSFNFVPGEFYGAGNGASWGYAKIVAKPGKTLPLWGTVNSGTITGPAWGTNSKDLGSSPSKYYHTSNGAGQFSETAVDLTSIGIDPIFNNLSGNTCNPPFTRIMVKTRSSASFSSALSDFAGPYAFLDAPVIPASIATPQALTCAQTSVNLSASNPNGALYYTWTTSNGNIIGRSDTSVITINQPGKYYLSTSSSTGCSQSRDSVIVTSDNYKPVATASSIGSINQSFTNTVQLLGGDTSQSNYNTPYGNSQGLLWNWSNSLGFSSTIQNPQTPDTGWHQLIVTEKRNGCKDTARTYVLWYNARVLESHFISLSATATSPGSTIVKWFMKREDGIASYNLERSEDGINFIPVSQVAASGNGSGKDYFYSDFHNLPSAAVIYYRLKIATASGNYLYTPQVKVVTGLGSNSSYLVNAYQQPSGAIVVNYFSNEAVPVTLKLVDMQGRIVASTKMISRQGHNSHSFTNNAILPSKQVVIVQAVLDNQSLAQKILLY
jgi:hypothetical protein